jgi:AraC-like DNA-binding protein
MKIDVQRAIDWLEFNLEEDVSLDDISTYLRYSPYHTSRMFKQYTGSTLRRYIQLRRLTRAAIDLRDTQTRIIDVAIKYNYSSQEAFSRAFKDTFDITPAEYIKTKRMIPYVFKKDVLFPDLIPQKGEIIMVKDEAIKITVETIPSHQFIYLYQDGVNNYMDFWEVMELNGKDCNLLHGVLASIPGIFPEGYGGFTKNGYLFGTDAPLDYDIEPSYGFNVKVIPEQTYLRFEHPGFTEAEFEEALRQVRRIALQEFDMKMHNYIVDDSFVKAYEHSGLELCYYYIRIPIKSK